MPQTSLENALDQVRPFLPDPKGDGSFAEDRVLSLLYPSPDDDGTGEKFDIAKKNLLQALDDEARGPEKLRAAARTVVESLSRDDLPPGGFALFTDGENTRFMELQSSPAPRLSTGAAALALPVLADAAGSSPYWLAILDVEQPRLLHVTDGKVKDKTPKDVTTLSETMEMYEPMADVTWHSSSSVRRSGIRQQFHALGTSTDDLKKDEIERVLMAFGKQVADIVSGPDDLILAGGPSRIGHFRQHFEHRNLASDDIKAAGEGLELTTLLEDADRLATRLNEERITADANDTDLSGAISDPGEMLTAALRGRIDRVMVHPDHTGRLSGNDERLRLPGGPDEDFLRRSHAVAFALKHGADLVVTRIGTEETGAVVTTRYD